MSSRSGRFWPLAGLGALVVLNIVLIALLVLRPTGPEAQEASDQASPAPFVTEPTHEETTTTPTKDAPAALPTPEDDEPEAGPAQRLLVNADATTAWRATVGTCTVAGELEHSMDGGDSWESMPLDLAPINRLRVLGPQTLFAIGGGAGCEPAYLSSSTAGASWLANDQFLVGSWYLFPGDPSSMAAPVGEIDAPCEAVDLAALNAQSAAVLCTDGALEVTSDGGATWDTTSPSLAALAVGAADDGYALAGTDEEACGDGVAVTITDTSGVAAGEVACSDAQLNDAAEVAISAAGSAVWLWSGDDILVSTDGGRTW